MSEERKEETSDLIVAFRRLKPYITILLVFFVATTVFEHPIQVVVSSIVKVKDTVAEGLGVRRAEWSMFAPNAIRTSNEMLKAEVEFADGSCFIFDPIIRKEVSMNDRYSYEGRLRKTASNIVKKNLFYPCSVQLVKSMDTLKPGKKVMKIRWHHMTQTIPDLSERFVSIHDVADLPIETSVVYEYSE